MLDIIFFIMRNFNFFFGKLKTNKNHVNEAHSYMSSSGGNQVDGLPPVCHYAYKDQFQHFFKKMQTNQIFMEIKLIPI